MLAPVGVGDINFSGTDELTVVGIGKDDSSDAVMEP
jgi:hypothetical protein